MCGLLANIGASLIDEEVFIENLALLSHRGPDFQQLVKSEKFFFGHTRLAIIDLDQKANQPFAKHGNKIIFNGEIYNYKELKFELENDGIIFYTDSDTEVLLEGIIKYGSEFLTKIRGMFAFLIYVEKTNMFIGARDRFGERPLYYTRHNNSHIFASEFKCIFKTCDRDLDLDIDSFNLYLHYQFIPEPNTLDRQIKKVPAGTYFQFFAEQEKFDFVHFWKMPELGLKETKSISENEIISNVRILLEQAVERTMVADVDIALSLSAGVDSSAIAALVAKNHRDRELHAFSLGYKGHLEIDERPIASRFSKELGIQLHSIEIESDEFVNNFDTLIDALDEPLADPAAYSHFLIPKQAHDMGFKVLLNGNGGDEFNWGYWWLPMAIRANEEAHKNYSGTRNLKRFFSRTNDLEAKYLRFYSQLPEFMEIYKLKKSYLKPSNQFQSQSELEIVGLIPRAIDIPMRVQKALVETWMTSNCLHLSDRVGMYNSVETRMPFLDADLIEYLNFLTSAGLSHTKSPKYYIKQALKDVLPGYILNREKTGFRIPNDEWMSKLISKYFAPLEFGYLVNKQIIDWSSLKLLKNKTQLSWHEQFFLYKLIIIERWVQSLK